MVTLITMNNRTRELIKKRMGDMNMSQVNLASRLTMTSSQVSRIISGDRGTTLENLLAIADVLQIERSYFLRVASGLNPEPDEDPWVEEQTHMLKLIPPDMRGVAGRFIDSIAAGEDAKQKSRKPAANKKGSG
jgi:transcriptional regulator with XRE-family HTH domain